MFGIPGQRLPGCEPNQAFVYTGPLRRQPFNEGEKMGRAILDEAHIHPAVRDIVAASHADIVREVQAATADHAVVIVGMAQNPFPRKARKLLDANGTAYRYLEYGNYLSGWRRRTALKMWTGWPTFPMVFVNGVLIGGASELQKLIENGEFARMTSTRQA